MKRLTEPVLAGLTLVMIGTIIGTKNVEMSDAASMMIVGLFSVALFAYVALVHREMPADEREKHISMTAGKYAYLAGALVLSIGIVAQSIEHDLDIWLPMALGAMVMTKLIAIVIHNR